MEYDLLSEHGFEEMYHEYFPKIYNYIFYRLMSREDTEDIVSAVFFKVAQNARAFDPQKASFKTWIYRIAQNTLTDHYRKKKIQTVPEEEAGDAAAVNFEQQLSCIFSEKRKVIFSELASLSEKERLIIYYKYFEDYTNRKIAMMLEMNESTVGTVLSRGLRKLRTDNIRELRRE